MRVTEIQTDMKPREKYIIHTNVKMLVRDVIHPLYRKVKINNPGLHKSYNNNSNNTFYQLQNTQGTINIKKKHYFSKPYLIDNSNVLKHYSNVPFLSDA